MKTIWKVWGLILSFQCLVCGAMFNDENFSYESMKNYREKEQKCLLGINEPLDLFRALENGKKFIAGNDENLVKINRLETAQIKKGSVSNEAMQNLIDDLLNKNMLHFDEDLDEKTFSLEEKISAVSEIVIVYQTVQEKVMEYSPSKRNSLVHFWLQLKYMMQERLKI